MNGRKIPEYCFRGIPKIEFIKDKLLLPEALQFEKVEGRTDDYLENSINWEDDENAVQEIFNQVKRDGEIQFKAGAAHINIQKVKAMLQSFIDTKEFAYERKVIYDEYGNVVNSYHGNFLVSSKLNKSHRNMISSGIAFATEEIIPNPKLTK